MGIVHKDDYQDFSESLVHEFYYIGFTILMCVILGVRRCKKGLEDVRRG